MECGVEGPLPPAPAQVEQVCQPVMSSILEYVVDPKASEPANNSSATTKMGNSFFMIAKNLNKIEMGLPSNLRQSNGDGHHDQLGKRPKRGEVIALDILGLGYW